MTAFRLRRIAFIILKLLDRANRWNHLDITCFQ